MCKNSNTPGIVFLFLFSLLSCHSQTEKEPHHTQEQGCLSQEEIQELKPLTVSDTLLSEKLRLNGKVEYNPNSVVNYVSLVSGVIVHTYVSLGDQVQKGQVLAEIKSAELNDRTTQIEQLNRKLEVAERELKAKEGFYTDRIASEKELLEAKAEKENIASELAQLKADLQFFSPSETKGVFQIRASQDGFIVNSRMVSGMQIMAEGDPIFTISNLNQIWVNLNIYPTEINVVSEGMPLTIQSNSDPDHLFTGKISHLSQVIDPEDNVLKARVVLDNQDLRLKPGMHVEGIVNTAKAQKSIRLPSKAVVFHNDQYYVVVIKNNCRTENRAISILSQDEHTLFLRSGLQPGEVIATQNALLQFEAHLGSNQNPSTPSSNPHPEKDSIR